MKLFKKDYKKYFIQCIFFIPLIMCVVTSISIKSFIDHKFLSHPVVIEQNLEKMVNYDMELITLENKIPLEKALIDTTKNIDEQEGIVASLFKKENGQFNYIYKYHLGSKNEFENVNVKNNFLKPELLTYTRGSYKIGKYDLNIEKKGHETPFTFYYLTYQDYVMVWCVRPDIAQSYFVDTENMFLIVVFILFINAVASFAALVAYYCLENRVDNILKKRGKHEKNKN